MKRKNGFYWVKYQKEWQVSEWYNDSTWLVAGNENCFDYDEMFEEIDENRIERTFE